MDEINKAAAILGTPVKLIDAQGYEQEIIAAAVEGGNGKIAYVRCRAKEVWPQHVDIHFHVHLRRADGAERSWPIKSYNPYFGCDVGLMEWMDDTVILIYREKHDTYICKLAPKEAPVFKEIADDWVINHRVIGYWSWADSAVSRLSLPDLTPLAPITEEEARAQGILPPKP